MFSNIPMISDFTAISMVDSKLQHKFFEMYTVIVNFLEKWKYSSYILLWSNIFSLFLPEESPAK